jgi:transcriptional regulator with XRE-family HTH domain
MPLDASNPADRLTGHALRNAHLRERSLARARSAPPLARLIVEIRAECLGMTRLEFARRSGISRGTLRDLELGVHTPTRRTLRQLLGFCQQAGVSPQPLEELRRLYAGPGETLEQVIARLELRAGSSRELARRVGISAVTLWEYRRGNFPLPLPLLRRLCEAVGEDPAPVEPLWHEAERRRLMARGYPEALAEFWVWCARAGYAEKHLLTLGLSMAAVRRLRYLELPAWDEVAQAARSLGRDERECHALQRLWVRDEQAQRDKLRDRFGPRLKQLRKRQGVTRRELADLFGIGGKKPARIIKHVEEDGFYSAQAYPAGLAAVLGGRPTEQARLCELWQERRAQFHRRHRPETRTELRLARELYGFELRDMEPILGYTSLEYQRIERGVSPLADTAQARILEAVHRAGQRRIEALVQHRQARAAEQTAWQVPPTPAAMIALLAKREGGLIPLARRLRKAGLKGLWPGRLRLIAQGKETPPWHVLEQVGRACEVADLTEARRAWREGFRAQLKRQCSSPLGIELRLLIAEVAPSPRAFSPRLGFNYSVLVRDLQRLDRDEPVKWYRVERILRALGVPADGELWREIHALWYTAKERRKTTGATPWNRLHHANGAHNGRPVG